MHSQCCARHGWQLWGAKCNASVSCMRMHARMCAYFHGGPAVHPLAVTQVAVGPPAPRIHDSLVTQPYRVLRPAGHGDDLDPLCRSAAGNVHLAPEQYVHVMCVRGGGGGVMGTLASWATLVGRCLSSARPRPRLP